MAGMDPVLTGSLCFLVLAIVMYVKFLRENSLHDDDDDLHQRQLHAHAKARKSSPIEPDAVPFLNPAKSPVAGGGKNNAMLPLPPQKKLPLSPRAQAPGHHGLAVLQKAQQYKQLQPAYYNQPKQPMRRRAHSAATNNQGHVVAAAAPSTIADPEMGLGVGHYGDGSDLHLQTQQQVSSAPRSSHRIDFGAMDFEQDDTAFFQPSSPQNLRHSMLETATYETHQEEHEGFDDDLESRLPPSIEYPSNPNKAPQGLPTPFMIGADVGVTVGPPGEVDGGAAAAISTPPAQTTPAKSDVKTTVIERQFVRDSVPPPAQMQLEVARKARIPLFLHSPMYVKTSAAPVDDSAAAPAAAAEQGGPAGTGTMTARQKEKLPPRCHKNQSLHIDFAALQVGEMIGQGAFGTVHRAAWRGTTVAVKILVCQYLTADILEEFETEVQIMSILRHPNICLLMGACLEPPTRCLVIEYLPRGSLWNVLRQEPNLEYDKQMTFARDTALGMNYLHSFQPPILHRDLKSPNLLVDTSYAIKISDFGLARVRAHFQTMTGNCGTTQWMAPEVLAAEKYTEKADVFSFGVVCWEIITGACPYDGLCQIQAALGVLNNNLRPTIPATCPEMFKKLMTLCWVSSPERRPTFEQILEFLHSNNVSLLDDLR